MNKYDIDAVRRLIKERQYDPKYRCVYDEESDPGGDECAYFAGRFGRLPDNRRSGDG